MERLTYQQARDKIIEAYFKGEIWPLNASFCFCGTLCDNDSSWCKSPMESHNNSHGYKGAEFVKMETALLRTMQSQLGGSIGSSCNHPEYENILFNGMSAALDVLKEIHKSRGENVDDPAPFVKRQLEKVI